MLTIVLDSSAAAKNQNDFSQVVHQVVHQLAHKCYAVCVGVD